MVNTFLPHGNVKHAVSLLDDRRLGKQRVEAYQIYLILTLAKKVGTRMKINPNTPANHIKIFDQLYAESGHRHGFYKHPMVLMWCGHIDALAEYTNFCIDEWVKRGFRNNMKHLKTVDAPIYPEWVSCPAVHYSHRAALLRKEILRGEPTHYVKIPLFAAMRKTQWYKYSYVWYANFTDALKTLASKAKLSSPEVVVRELCAVFVPSVRDISRK